MPARRRGSSSLDRRRRPQGPRHGKVIRPRNGKHLEAADAVDVADLPVDLRVHRLAMAVAHRRLGRPMVVVRLPADVEDLRRHDSDRCEW